MAEFHDHPTLGKLTWNDQLNCWQTTVEFVPGISIDVRLRLILGVAHTNNIDGLCSKGEELIKWARLSDAECRKRISNKLLEVYNEDWASAEDDTPGSMSPEEFMKSLHPDSVVLDINDSAFFYYNAPELFAGHSIVVRVDSAKRITEIALAG